MLGVSSGGPGATNVSLHARRLSREQRKRAWQRDRSLPETNSGRRSQRQCASIAIASEDFIIRELSLVMGSSVSMHTEISRSYHLVKDFFLWEDHARLDPGRDLATR